MSREDVIRQIVERDIQNQGLSEEVIAQEAPALYSSACELYGTWETALRYAGINERRAKHRRPPRSANKLRIAIDSETGPDVVIKIIQTLCMQGYDLTARHNARRDPRLYEAALRHFGTWKQALLAGGINLDRVRIPKKHRRYNREELIAQLQRRYTVRPALTWLAVCLEDRAFAMALKSSFGSWKSALIAAGLRAEHTTTPHRSKWNQQSVLDAIRLRHEQGKPLKCVRVREDDGGLVCAARRFFATWDEAVAAAEIPDLEAQ